MNKVIEALLYLKELQERTPHQTIKDEIKELDVDEAIDEVRGAELDLAALYDVASQIRVL